MLISFLLSVFEFILTFVLNVFSEFAPVFNEVAGIFEFGLSIISQGMQIVSFFFNPGDLIILCDFWIFLFLVDHTLDIAFFILRKIPFLNIK